MEPTQDAPSTSQLPADLADFKQQFQQIQAESQALAGSLSVDQFNRQPAPGHWSVGQCLSHLNAAGYPLADNMEEAIARGRERGHTVDNVQVRHGLIGRFFIYLQQPSTRIPLPMPDAYSPAEGRLDPRRVLRNFSTLQDRFIACLGAARDLDVNRIRVSSPISKLLRFRMGTWLEITLAHERRHLAQARRAMRAVGIDIAQEP